MTPVVNALVFADSSSATLNAWDWARLLLLRVVA